MNPIDKNWTTETGLHDGGVSTGVGYTIAWQRGGLNEGRNGAYLLEVLASCLAQLDYYQSTSFACGENEIAREYLQNAIDLLERRRIRRDKAGVLGTQEPDPQ